MGRTVEVPPLIPETEAEHMRMEEGRERQAYRLAQGKRHTSQGKPGSTAR